MNKNNLFKRIPVLSLSVLLWAALAVLLLIGLVIVGQRYAWPGDLVTTLRTLIVLLIGLRIIADIRKALAKGRAELLSRLAMGDDEPIQALSWKDSVTGVYLIHILLYAGLILLVIFAVGGTFSGFLVSGTLLSVMLGVAGQSFFANFFGGLAIAIFKPFEIGDHVQIVAWQLPVMVQSYPHETRSQGYVGFIRDINLFYSDLRLDDGRQLKVPNGVVINAGIVQMRSYEWLRTSFRFDVPMTAEVAKVLQGIEAAAHRHFDTEDISADGILADSTVPARSGMSTQVIETSVPPLQQINKTSSARPVDKDVVRRRPLYWHPPEVLLVDLSPTTVSVEVHASVLNRTMASRKDDFFREVLAGFSSDGQTSLSGKG
ncbi:MAG: mechanosensitive ion channel family protein [Acidiferrobacteraceae bacterium]